MNLFIRIENGQPVNHPILENNFCQSFPQIDLNNLPETFAKFVRIDAPALGVYEVYEGATYEWADGVVQDVHHVRPMTDEEKLAKQNAVKLEWVNCGRPSWTFNETTCWFDPPVPYPDDGKPYKWDEASVSWVEIA